MPLATPDGRWSAGAASGLLLARPFAALSYADLVHGGKDAIAQHWVWIIPTCVILFAIYVLVARKVMPSREQLPAAAADPAR